MIWISERILLMAEFGERYGYVCWWIFKLCKRLGCTSKTLGNATTTENSPMIVGINYNGFRDANSQDISKAWCKLGNRGSTNQSSHFIPIHDDYHNEFSPKFMTVKWYLVVEYSFQLSHIEIVILLPLLEGGEGSIESLKLSMGEVIITNLWNWKWVSLKS